MAKDTATAPKLPPASVDFNALHDACKAGGKAADVAAAALIKPRAAAEPASAATKTVKGASAPAAA